jgi:hypothetical protein
MPYPQDFSTPTTQDDLDPLYLVAHALIIGCISEIDPAVVTGVGVRIALLTPYAKFRYVHSF